VREICLPRILLLGWQQPAGAPAERDKISTSFVFQDGRVMIDVTVEGLRGVARHGLGDGG